MRVSAPFAALFFLSAGAFARADSPVAALKSGDTISSCVEPDRDSAHAFKPHCRETIVRSNAKSEMSYNALGLRDKDYPDHPKPGWKRILFVGASRMAGPGLQESDTPPRRLEKYFGGAKNKIEVINAGVEGYSPVLEATRIHAWLEAYHPTHVVIDVDFEPSISMDSMYSPYQEEGKDGQPHVSLRVFGWMKPVAMLLGIDTSKYAGQRKVITWQSAGDRMLRAVRCRVTSYSREALTMCMARPTIEALAFMRKAAVATGAKVIFIFPPGTFTNGEKVSPAFDAEAFETFDRFTPLLTLNSSPIVSAYKKRNVPVQFLIPVRGDDLTLPNDYHFNQQGADLFARGAMLRLQGFVDAVQGGQVPEPVAGPERGE